MSALQKDQKLNQRNKMAEEVKEKIEKVEEKKTEEKTKEIAETPKEKTSEKKEVENKKQNSEKNTKVEAKKDSKKQDSKFVKDEAFVNSKSVPVSTKKAIAICKFIKFKSIENAMKDLEEVIAGRKSVPTRGEIPHKKGPGKIGSGSGIYPKKASVYFIKILKSLKANANVNGIENPVIVEAVANKAMRPRGQFGRVQRKRTHVTLKAKEKK